MDGRAGSRGDYPQTAGEERQGPLVPLIKEPLPGQAFFQLLEGSLTGSTGPAAVFIDIIGRPLTPVSFAGAARRTAYRGAFYGAAAVDTALAPKMAALTAG